MRKEFLALPVCSSMISLEVDATHFTIPLIEMHLRRFVI